ncbi:Glycoside hydrolase family 13 protein [Mycena kentingensis (nom. inval.)]|nr:Glycoside hydrolase family 13 protein [Mycena kentingensis (nom. inval.)]
MATPAPAPAPAPSSVTPSPSTSPPPAPARSVVKWWKDAVVYQIYPISYADSNGDGLGDLQGIISKLDYLKDLGVDVVWLCPIFKSPLADMGYDIADYRDVDPRYGTLADYDALVAGLHARGMKLIMDLVVNHSSDEHEWFQESKSSKTNPKRDWYIWRPPRYDKDGKRRPPNNWKACFGGSTWEYDEATDEYYLHLFLKKQPDLNWENPEVRAAVQELMKFWCDRGCDGFRMNVISCISKVAGLPDAPTTLLNDEFQPAYDLYTNGPRVHEYIQELHREVFAKYDLLTVGEASFTLDPVKLAEYVLPENKELDMLFTFEQMALDEIPDRPFVHRRWALPEMMNVFERWQGLDRSRGFWNTVFMENHDSARSVSRWGSDSPTWRAQSAKMLAILQATLAGTQYIYQGQEIGMRNFPKEWGISEYRDVATYNWYNEVLGKRCRELRRTDIDMTDVLDGLAKKARDHARIPMQWDATEHAGFTKGPGKPWMRVDDDYAEWNVAVQQSDPDSVLAFWKACLRLRKANKVLVRTPPLAVFLSGTKPSIYFLPSLLLYIHKIDSPHADLRHLRTPRPAPRKDLCLPAPRWSSMMLRRSSRSGERAALRLVFGNYAKLEEEEDRDRGWAMSGEVEMRGYEGRVYQA